MPDYNLSNPCNFCEGVTMLKEEKKKNYFVSVRFSYDEKEQIKSLAILQQKTLSEMIRVATLEAISLSRGKIVPEVNRQIYFQLGKMAEYLETSEMDEAALNSLQELLKEIRRELLGLTS
jgi:hypothetical protein